MDDIARLYQVFRQSSGITTDSRNVDSGQIFFALKGKRFDGNRYARSALENGAVSAVVDDPNVIESPAYILVDDALVALQKLSAHHRNQFDIDVIALTGTNGKTTTKELLDGALSTRYDVHATKGNLNNHIGVPLTLLGLKDHHQLAVIEMGASAIGEIEQLCRLALPTYGVITNIGAAHLEGFGSIEGVLTAKKELFDHLVDHKGTIFINGSDPRLCDLYAEYPRRKCYGNGRSDFEVVQQKCDPFLHLQLRIEGTIHTVQTSLIGQYNTMNVLSAFAMARQFDVGIEDIIRAVAFYRPQNNRSALKKVGTNHFIMDAYNANPTSMMEAITSFAQMNVEKKILVLGEMLELGTDSAYEHERLLNSIYDADWSNILVVGYGFKSAAKEKGLTYFDDVHGLAEWFASADIDHSWILLKGSRGVGLERLLEQLN